MYLTECATCGPLPDVTFFRDDAISKGDRHQEKYTSRLVRWEAPNPEHACRVVVQCESIVEREGEIAQALSE